MTGDILLNGDTSGKYYSEIGLCPSCKRDALDYGSIEVVDNGVFYPCECDNCGFKTEEHFTLEFLGYLIPNDES